MSLIEFEATPFLRVVALSAEDAKEWAFPKACYAVDYIKQADPKRHRFGARVYRVWTMRPTPKLREEWNAL